MLLVFLTYVTIYAIHLSNGERFEYAKGVNRRRESRKDRHTISKRKRTNNDLQNITQKTND